MMDTMIKENGITFKELEKEIFAWVCEVGRSVTAELLEKYDKYLMEKRDTKAYRHKGKRITTVKTVYGEVTYQRAVYETKAEDGTKRYVYLLDETLELENVGLISTNLAERLVSGITELSYRECARQVSELTGQRISAMGVWNVIQSLGEAVCREETELVEADKRGKVHGEKEMPVLFEEVDGVYVRLQGKDRRQRKQDKVEMKVAIAYDGWKKEGKDRYRLDGKVVTAGFAKAKEFHEIREAQIGKEYNIDEVAVRLLNADGASWIKKVRDKSTVFQLDPFHKYKALKENLPDKKAQEAVLELLEAKKIDEMFEYLGIYRDSLSGDEEIEKAEKLIQYFDSNRDGLIPYEERGLDLPGNQEGLEYRSMGTMENHVWSVIARRMKHNHTSWSIKGGNHLAKILAKKCSGKLYEVTEKLKKPLFEEEKIEEFKEEILSSVKAPKQDGKGYRYPVMGHLNGLENATRGDRKTLFAIAGY